MDGWNGSGGAWRQAGSQRLDPGGGSEGAEQVGAFDADLEAAGGLVKQREHERLGEALDTPVRPDVVGIVPRISAEDPTQQLVVLGGQVGKIPRMPELVEQRTTAVELSRERVAVSSADGHDYLPVRCLSVQTVVATAQVTARVEVNRELGQIEPRSGKSAGRPIDQDQLNVCQGLDV